MIDVRVDKPNFEDALRISILLQTVYIQAYAQEGVSFEFANFIQEKFSEEKVENKIEGDPCSLLVSYYKNNPIGVAEILYDSTCPIRKITTPELGKLYVLEKFHGKGVAVNLLQKVEETIKLKGYTELYLEVWTKNSRAIKFYEKQGYQTLGKADFPMKTNTYINLVMNKVLR